jgi:hypothetical protein
MALVLAQKLFLLSFKSLDTMPMSMTPLNSAFTPNPEPPPVTKTVVPVFGMEASTRSQV